MREMSLQILEERMPKITRGDTRKFRITIRDMNENLVDPDWVKLEFKKTRAHDSPYGPYLADRESLGIYFCIWRVPPGTTLGEWIREWTWNIQVGIVPHIGTYQSSFEVIDKTEEVKTFG